jgi:hypothetical protein
MRLAGNYLRVSIDSTKQFLNLHPIIIQEDGVVKFKSTNDILYIGEARFFKGSILTIILTHRVHPECDPERHDGMFLFFTGNLSYAKIKHLYGLSNLLSSNTNSPRASREVLLKSDILFSEAKYDIIKLPLATDNKEVITKFKNFNIEYENLGMFFFGEENNLIKSFREPNRGFKRLINYGELFFTSACYHASIGQYEKAKENLKRAFEHGFALIIHEEDTENEKHKEKQLLEEELQKSLKNIADKIDLSTLSIKD